MFYRSAQSFRGSDNRQTSAALLAAVVFSGIFLPGCGSENENKAQREAGLEAPKKSGEVVSGAGVGVGSAGGVTEAQLAAITNQLAVSEQSQKELIQSLLSRIEQLEKKEAQQAGAAAQSEKSLQDEIKTRDERGPRDWCARSPSWRERSALFNPDG